MLCPFCSANDDKVVDSRAAEGGSAIRRRRQCLKCNRRFTTYEHIEDNVKLTVVKRDGSRVPYDRNRVIGGIEKACYKRPVSPEQIQEVVDFVEEELFKQHEREVDSYEIGRVIAERLKRLDQVAYVRFASVYKQFRDLDDFLDEVREVLAQTQVEVPGQGRLFP